MIKPRILLVAWLVLIVAVGIFLGELWMHREKQFYVVTAGSGQSAVTYVCTIEGKTWWSPVPDMLVLRDVYLIQPADSQHPEKGFRAFHRDHALYWPWETLVPVKDVSAVEPVNRESPLMQVVRNAQ
jgi:hypothetical protein